MEIRSRNLKSVRKSKPENYDIIIAGGGLAGGLAAMALRAAHPDIRLLIVEAGAALGGNHLWSCFASDLDAASRDLVAPLFAHHWQGNEVAFPAHRRRLAGDYASIPSARFDAVVREALGADAVMADAPIAALTPASVMLADGTRLAGPVLDCRGAGDLGALELGWQKFVGRVLRLDADHGIVRPLIMDATVVQIDGYRFVYVLPFDARTVFVEDTYYSDTPDLDAAALGARIANYAQAQGWQVAEVVHEEHGVLPVAMAGDFGAYWESGGRDIAKGGVRAGLFHPLTSYSLPEAARFALALAKAWPPKGQKLDLHHWTRDYAQRRWRANGFYRLLGKMLFRAAAPDQRYRLLERFYRLPEPLIGRFYAGQSTLFDRLRILWGKPPVPIGKAVQALIGKRA